jgi:glycosyltransferase involved in cell wall biosynthesis
MIHDRTVCLSMIVKNEARVIRRCLDSVRPVIDRWVIVDTGSTDGTQDIIREHMKDVPGELHERPWRDFAHNRTESLELARPHADYTLIIDADDALEVPALESLPPLELDSYLFQISLPPIVYQRRQLVRSALPWRYVGVLHEFITCEEARTEGELPFVIHINSDGARRCSPETYRRDAETLQAAFAAEKDPMLRSRYAFYLAQSLRDCGERERALEHYLLRSNLGHWTEEIYVSLCEAGRIMEALERPEAEIIDTYLRASRCVPTRAEAWHAASRFCRLRKRFEEGLVFASQGLQLSQPQTGLFVQPWVYRYGLLDEYSIHAYWVGDYSRSLEACLTLLGKAELPAEYRERVAQNADFARRKLAG